MPSPRNATPPRALSPMGIPSLKAPSSTARTRGGAIGVFDSGIGGLTVVREILRILPRESIVYLGDTARVPYGNKSRETVVKFSTENLLFLLHHDVKLVVVACHTASSFALPFLERHFKRPILGVIEPGVETALQVTRTGRVGVIGTQATVGSQAYPRLFARSGSKVRVTQVACPLFVPLVEEGCTGDAITREVARRYLKPLQQARVDTVILGCTHYPLLKPTLAHVLGTRVRLIDSARQVALKTRQTLEQLQWTAPKSGRASPLRKFFVTDEPRHFERLAHRFLGCRPGNVSKADVASL